MRLTGFDALAADGGSDAGGPGLLLEALIGGAGALLVLTFVFGSLLALVPMLMAVVSIMSTFLRCWGSPSHQRLADRRVPDRPDRARRGDRLLAADRLPLARGARAWTQRRRSRPAAWRPPGRAVVFSGLAVAIGLLALIALPVPFLRSMGYGGVLSRSSVLVAITLLPVVLAKLGPRAGLAAPAHRRQAQPRLDAWAQAVARQRWGRRARRMAVMLALAFAATDLRMGGDDADTMANSGDAKLGLAALEHAGIGEGSAAAARGARRWPDRPGAA